ncbi:Fur family transcriptional regulator [Chryseobacterium gambrini]|uniref:Fur family transcriptional regulator, ferric uptake regulator n=1 Tax=Chryseobacterium gambrini TaxID=373672 RepID=A0A1N7K2D9_9FLAO|nr:transcriptional repressor [Chryseobacterium gambrini]SIS55706.1 Fur family transcriptional regulator, ferric uptake regulator [Chryseobacterium gambrini]
MTELEKILLQKAIKPTAMRLLVVEKLLKQQYAVSHKELAEQFEKADNITLFRTLKVFLEYKLVHTIDDGSGVIKYALCQSGCNCNLSELHTHFYCTDCKHIFCLTETEIPNIEVPQNFKLDGANLVLKGKCDKCNK